MNDKELCNFIRNSSHRSVSSWMLDSWKVKGHSVHIIDQHYILRYVYPDVINEVSLR